MRAKALPREPLIVVSYAFVPGGVSEGEESLAECKGSLGRPQTTLTERPVVELGPPQVRGVGCQAWVCLSEAGLALEELNRVDR